MKGVAVKLCLDLHRQRLHPGQMFEVVQDRTIPNDPMRPNDNGPKKVYKAGEIPITTFENWCASGHARPARDGEASVGNPMAIDHERSSAAQNAPVPAPGQPGVVTQPGQPGVVTQQGGGVTRVGHAAPPEPSTQGKLTDQPISPWVFDPQALEGRTTEDLNALIGDRITEQQRVNFVGFPTPQEAIAFLSQDFKAPTAEGQAARS